MPLVGILARTGRETNDAEYKYNDGKTKLERLNFITDLNNAQEAERELNICICNSILRTDASRCIRSGTRD